MEEVVAGCMATVWEEEEWMRGMLALSQFPFLLLCYETIHRANCRDSEGNSSMLRLLLQ